MGTRLHTTLITLVYLGLALCLTALLTTAQIEDFPHQIFGITFFVLVVCHLILNRFWIKHSLSGRWNLHRVCVTATVAALALLTIAQAINCVLLSSYFWSLLPESFAYFSASLHMCFGTWFFVVAGIHFGLNVNVLIGNKLRLARSEKGTILANLHNVLVIAALILLGIVGMYGIVVFVQLEMPQYMFMMQTSEVTATTSLVVRFLQYLCVGIALTGITHSVSVLVQRKIQHHKALMAKGRAKSQVAQA